MSNPFARFQARSEMIPASTGQVILQQPSPRIIGDIQHGSPPTMNRLDAKMAMVSSEGSEHIQYAEIMRICDLPLMWDMDDAEVDAYTQMNVLAEAYNAGFRLFPIQARGVYSYERIRGLFAPIGVGFGKTLTSLMIANKGYLEGFDRQVLFVPSNVLIQLSATDLKWARNRVPFAVPVHFVAGKSMEQRRALAKSGKKGLYVMTYSLLSTKDAEELLYEIKPSQIIADECQNLRHHEAARTRRYLRYCNDHQPKQAYLSGTITNKSILDYHHLIRGALGPNCPLPHSASLAREWAAVIDATANTEAESANAGPLRPLVLWAQRNFPQEQIPENVPGFRRAFQYRLNTAPGVASSGDAAIGTSLTIANRPVLNPEECEGWEKLEKLIEGVDDLWETPDGDPIEFAIHKWKWLYELCAGFYNQLTWPTVDTFARRKSMTEAVAQEILFRAELHHLASKEFSKELHKWLETESRIGLDTPLLVTSNMARRGSADVGQKLFDLWDAKRKLDFDGRPDRDSTAVRVCDFKIKHVTDWAKKLDKGRGALIWVCHQEIGRWVYEYMRAAQLDVVHCPAGNAHNAAILDPANGGKIIVASIESHGTGKNLQHFQEQFVVQWPRPETDAEQMLGRTHRSGQLADELVAHTCNTMLHDDLNFAACLNDALYAQQSLGIRQKIIYANYDPLPKIFPAAVLFERGLKPKQLTSMQQEMMAERFGQK